MRGKTKSYKINLIIVFIFLSSLLWAAPCFSKTTKNDVVDKALAQGEKGATAEKAEVKKAKTLAEDVKSFKRFRLNYESKWLSGRYRLVALDQSGITTAGGFNDKGWFKSKLKTRLDVFSADFYFTPKTYLEGTYATGDFSKDQSAAANLFDLNIFGLALNGVPLHLTGKKLNIWNVDLYQNVYTHKNTGIAVDLFAGFISYQDKIRLKYNGEVTGGFGANDPVAAFDRRMTGPRLGFKYRAPFTLPDLPNNPFTFEITTSYARFLRIHSSGEANLAPLVSAMTTSDASKGYMLDSSAGVSFRVTPYLAIEVLYNYMFVKQHGGTYDGVPQFEARKITNTYYGPSAKITGSF